MKRLFDVVVVVTVLLLLLPLMIVIATLVRAKLGSPIFFRQQRPGLHGHPFSLVKFRTMLDASDDTCDEDSDSERVTRFGQLLRATSLDELPELWNVLRGDMSLIGPRPLLMEYLPLYSAEQMRRHEVRPGITGWAQVKGRNQLSWEKKFKLDVWYVDNQSFWLDLYIIVLTFVKVLRREGISYPGETTMPKFTGTQASDGL
jgi:lipopolysaccharide/colanic/teichoic acid biosynthesis glycosyltransferase